MTVPKRKKFVVDMLDLYDKKYNATDMFHNIMGVLDFMIDDHVAEYGSWASLVDSCILNGVEMGLAINEHKASASTVNPGAKKWATFFTYSQNNPGDSNQKRKLWS